MKCSSHTLRRRSFALCLAIALALSFLGFTAGQTTYTVHALALRPAENNNASPTPFMGWSSWNFIGSHPTEANMEAQAQVVASQLKSHGYNYVLLDDFWYLNPSTTVDQYGRWSVDTGKFPNGLSGFANYVHGLGLKVGFYLTPGIPVAAVNQNTPIEGTSYHAQDIADTSSYEANYNFGNVMYHINYSKPGAQAYINSWANELASWGADFLKLDGVGDGDVGDIQAWSQALQQTGRTIVFDLSNSLDVNNGNTWKQYSNAWRIDGDVECYCSTQVTWNSFVGRFNDAPAWVQYAGPNAWNDLDALQIADGQSVDGITNDERQTYMTLWAIEAAPLYAGDDLGHMDSYGLSLLTNDEVIAVDQAGHAARPISQASSQQVWYANNGDGTYTVALFNLGGSSANVTANWSDLGFSGTATIRDLWSHTNLGSFSGSFSATLNSHASRLLKVTAPSGSGGKSYEAESSANTLAGGAVVVSCSACSGGQKVGNIGNGGTLQFNHVNVSNAGTYIMTISYVDGDAGRSAQVSVNGGPNQTLNFAGYNGNWNTVQTTTVPVILTTGNNTILFSNASAWAPDIDCMTITGSGYVSIINVNSGKYLDVYQDSQANNAGIVQFTSNSQADQEWSLQNASGGYVKIINRNSGKLLNIPGSTTTQGTQLIQYQDDNNSNSQWEIGSLTNDAFTITSRYDSQVVDVYSLSKADNAQVIQWPSNGGANQQWTFAAV